MLPFNTSPQDIVNRFLGWWGRELLSLTPVALQGPLRPRRQLAVVIGADGPQVYEERARRRLELTLSKDRIGRVAETDALLSQNAKLSRRRPVVLRLPHEMMFQRTVLLPTSVVGDLPRIMLLDLERATPFRRDDVLAAHFVLPQSPSTGRVAVRQCILKHNTLRQALEGLEKNGFVPDRIECCSADGITPLPIDFMDWNRGPPINSSAALPRKLALTACLLAVTAAVVMITRLENAVGDLERQIASVRAKAATTTADRIQRGTIERHAVALLELRNSEVSRAALIDRLTQILPSTDYLTALRIDGSEIEMSGYSASTAVLVPLIERSKFLSGAALSSPAILDARNGKERFTLRARTIDARPSTGRNHRE